MRHVLSCTVLIALLVLSFLPADGAGLHFRLERSSPEAGAAVEEVTEVRLWFSEEPQAGSTSIRVLDASGELVSTGEPRADEKDARVQVLALNEPLVTGAYTVMWRAMAADGHVVRDEFDFTVGP